jgi:hypothetical protein
VADSEVEAPVARGSPNKTSEIMKTASKSRLEAVTRAANFLDLSQVVLGLELLGESLAIG